MKNKSKLALKDLSEVTETFSVGNLFRCPTALLLKKKRLYNPCSTLFNDKPKLISSPSSFSIKLEHATEITRIQSMNKLQKFRSYLRVIYDGSRKTCLISSTVVRKEGYYERTSEVFFNITEKSQYERPGPTWNAFERLISQQPLNRFTCGTFCRIASSLLPTIGQLSMHVGDP